MNPSASVIKVVMLVHVFAKLDNYPTLLIIYGTRYKHKFQQLSKYLAGQANLAESFAFNFSLEYSCRNIVETALWKTTCSVLDKCTCEPGMFQVHVQVM